MCRMKRERIKDETPMNMNTDGMRGEKDSTRNMKEGSQHLEEKQEKDVAIDVKGRESFGDEEIKPAKCSRDVE